MFRMLNILGRHSMLLMIRVDILIVLLLLLRRRRAPIF